MSFAAGMGAGIACGFTVGLAAGKKQARAEIAALLEARQIEILEREGLSVPLDILLDEASAPPAGNRTILILLLLGGLALFGAVLFWWLAR